VCRERETERERERERGGEGERESGREGEREKGRERESGAHKRGHSRMRVCKHAADSRRGRCYEKICKRTHSVVREHILGKYLAYTDSRRGRCYEKIWYLAYKLFRFHLNVAVDDEDVPRLRTHVCVRLAINNASSATVLYRTAWRAVTDTKLDGSPLINENLKGELPHPVYNMYVLIVDGEGDECSEHLGYTHDMQDSQGDGPREAAGAPQMLARTIKVARFVLICPICPNMSHICPNVPYMSHVCPDMSHICPNMSHICPNVPYMS